MRSIGRMLGGVALVALAGLHAHALYSIGIVAAAAVFGRGRRSRARSELPCIAVLVVAHDEEDVIAASVQSLVHQRYPKDRFEVFVVADRCADRTAMRAREAGATVLERSAAAGSKNEAVRFGVEHISARVGFDAVAIFDADNLADELFLMSVGERLASGESVVQGYVDVQNPGRSWVSKSSALGFYAIAALAQKPRESLGLSAPLMGTAFAARREICERLFPRLSSLTDDLELGALLALDGIRVAYEPNARALDEKPTRLSQAVGQRHRWMQGRWTVAERYLPRLLEAAVAKQRPLEERARALDVGVQLVSPSLLFSSVALGVGGMGLAWTAGAFGSPLLAAVGRLSSRLAAVYFLVPAAAIRPLGPPKGVWLAYGLQPAYLLLSVPLALSGFLTRRSTHWERTRHGDSKPRETSGAG